MDTKIFPQRNDIWFPFCWQDDLMVLKGNSTVMLATVLPPFKTCLPLRLVSLLDTCPYTLAYCIANLNLSTDMFSPCKRQIT